MADRKWIGLFLFLSIVSCIFISQNVKADGQPLLGDVSDGNRSVPVHLIEMFDADSGRIRPTYQPLMPFSTKQTCSSCHSYQKISSGWHFNAGESKGFDGRVGQPWLLVDYMTATQIPLSYRNWSGVFNPRELGLTNFEFVNIFGRQMPGGGVGEDGDADPPEQLLRWLVSGQLEINCLSCHEGDPAHDQAEYAAQVARQNYRWAAAASSAFGHVYGSAKAMPDNYDIYAGSSPDDSRSLPPTVEYSPGIFNSRGKVFFNITRKVPNERCYFCHSTKYIGGELSERWQSEEDVHLKSGMMCVDCHRHGLDHEMIRGYEGEAEERGERDIAVFTCKGCHVLEKSEKLPVAGRLGAPQPKHVGIPTIHFQKLTCTACHSGPWPTNTSFDVKTSMSHAMGVYGSPKSNESAPRVVAPVFTPLRNGKLAPQKVVYPAFWTFINGDSLEPISLETVRQITFDVISNDSLTDSTNFAKILAGEWPQLSEEQLSGIFGKLQDLDSTKTVGYVGAGKVRYLDASGTLVASKNIKAEPYSWPIAHDVRPASQSLGVHGCKDCHSLNAAFHFGKVTVHDFLKQNQQDSKSMLSFQDSGVIFPRLFALTFLVRPYLKIFLILCSVVIAVVLLKYAIGGLDRFFKIVEKKKW